MSKSSHRAARQHRVIKPLQPTLEALTHTAAALGVEISPHALEQRFTAAAAACLPQGLVTAIARVIPAEPVAIPRLERLTAV